MLTPEEVTARIIEAHNVRRWYQKPSYGGIEWPVKTHFEDGRIHPSSFGEGRWFNYINPILFRNNDDWKNSSLCEIGCSAGLFLLRAWEDFYFKRLLGVEAANGGYKQLLLTKDYYDELPLETYKMALGRLTNSIADSDAPLLDMYRFPIVDVTLMSCVHYHMELSYLKHYINELALKSQYLVLLTDENAGGPTVASSNYFKSVIISNRWQLVDEVKTPPNWVKPVKMPLYKDITVLLYKSKVLKRLLVKDCFMKQLYHNKYAEVFYDRIFPPFIEAVLKGKIHEGNHHECLVYQWQREGYYGSTAWDEITSSERVLSYINMAKTIKEHGQEQPIGLQEHLDMVDPWDGFHRIAVLHYFGYKYVYGVDVIPER